MKRIGVISDTHGLLRAEALAALRGAELILHAGDIGKPDILDALERLAPVVAVRGNNDRVAWADAIPERRELDIDGHRICLLHDLKELEPAHGFDIVVTGHSHRPKIERRDGVLYLNPGSAGPRRFSLPVSVAWLMLAAGDASAQLIELVPRPTSS